MKINLLICLLFSTPVVVAQTTDSAERSSSKTVEHAKVRQFADEQGNLQPITNVKDWEIRRGDVLRSMQLVMGELPDRSKLGKVDYQVIDEVRLENGIKRLTIRFRTEEEDIVPALLLLPKRAEGKKAPAILALHQTIPIGKQEPAGMGGSTNLHYGKELAERGYVVLIPDYPSFGDYAYDFSKHRQWMSGSLKAIWNNMRAVDLLQQLDEVDPQRLGVIGHSLGGHNSIFTAVFDQRLKVVVTSCGFTRFHKYYGGNLKGWTSDRYMPIISQQYGNDPNRVPFDFPELLAAIAPRAFFTNSPTHDDNFDCDGVRETIAEAAFVYGLYNAADNLVAKYPDSAHDFPPATRREAYDFIDTHLKQ